MHIAVLTVVIQFELAPESSFAPKVAHRRDLEVSVIPFPSLLAQVVRNVGLPVALVELGPDGHPILEPVSASLARLLLPIDVVYAVLHVFPQTALAVAVAPLLLLRYLEVVGEAGVKVDHFF